MLGDKETNHQLAKMHKQGLYMCEYYVKYLPPPCSVFNSEYINLA